MTELDREIRTRVLDVLQGTLPVETFEEWLVANAWDERTRFAAQVDHLLAERSVLTDDEFCEQLRKLASTVEVTESVSAVTTAATAETIRPEPVHLGRNQTIRRTLVLAGR